VSHSDQDLSNGGMMPFLCALFVSSKWQRVAPPMRGRASVRCTFLLLCHLLGSQNKDQ